MILAAKAFRAAQRLSGSSQDAIYPLLIASHAVNRASLYDGSDDFRVVVYATEYSVFEELKKYTGNDPLIRHEIDQLKYRLPRANFFFRLFEDAANAYADVPISSDDKIGRAWAAWGEGISLFAYGADATAQFETLMQMFGARDGGVR